MGMLSDVVEARLSQTPTGCCWQTALFLRAAFVGEHGGVYPSGDRAVSLRAQLALLAAHRECDRVLRGGERQDQLAAMRGSGFCCAMQSVAALINICTQTDHTSLV